MKIKNPKLLAFCILISQLAGVIGSLATTPAIPGWYEGLNKPFFNPPNWLFGPVWITLYTLMGISLYLVWIKNDKRGLPHAVRIFLIHLAVNSLWSVVFFGMKLLMVSFIIIIVLFFMIIYLIKIFSKIDKNAGRLLYPYLLWVSLAALLNFSIWQLN